MLRRYYCWLPVLWLAGVYVFVMLGMMLRLAWRRWPTGFAINLIFFAWLVASAMQAVSVIYNWSLAELPLRSLIGLLLSNTTIGWGLLGLGLAVGYGSRLASPAAVRAMMIFALQIILFGLVAHALAIASGLDRVWIPSPLRIILGESPATNFYMVSMFYHVEVGVRRLTLFFPWSTALSLGGICLILIATCETDRRWRMVGYAGGLFAVAFSFSRMGWVALPLVLAILIIARANRALILAGIALCALAGLAMLATNIDPADLVSDLVADFHDYRSGSSLGRQWVYEESWRAFLRSPYIGWGWVGPTVVEGEHLPIGSHSTFYGTLYTGGLLTLGALVSAAMLTLAVLVHRLIRSPDERTIAALGIYVALLFFSFGDSFYSLVLPLMFALLFVGGTLANPTENSEEHS